jgi:hypothetical protein
MTNDPPGEQHSADLTARGLRGYVFREVRVELRHAKSTGLTLTDLRKIRLEAKEALVRLVEDGEVRLIGDRCTIIAN